MNAEELKLILETVENTTGEAKTVILTWIIAGALKVIFKTSAVLLGIWIVIRTVSKLIFSFYSAGTFVRDLAEKHAVNVENHMGDISREGISALRSKLDV